MIGRKTSSEKMSGSISRRDLLIASAAAVPAALVLPAWIRGTASAATTFDYYISPSGSDSNPGTESQPWAITALNTKRSVYSPAGSPGKRVGLLDGTYNVSSLLNSVSQDGYVPALDINGGIAGSPVVIAAVNPQKAVITAKVGGTYGCSGGNPIMGHSDAVPKRGYVTFDGIVFTGASGKCLDWGVYGSAFNGVRYPGLTVQNCEFTDCNASRHGLGGNYSLLQMYGASGALAQNNYFHDNVGWQAGSGDHHSAIIVWYTDNPVIQYNTVINSANIFGKETGNQGAVIRFNYIDASMYSSGVTGIADFAGTPATGLSAGNKFYNNVIIAMQGIDLCSTLANGAATIPSADVYSNTIVMTSGGAIMAFRAWVQPRSVSFYNNLITGTPGSDPGTISTNVSAFKMSDFNFFPTTASGMRWSTFPDGGSPGSRSGYATLALWRLAAALLSLDVNSLLSATPMFTGTGVNAEKYKLQSGSPAKGVGRVGGVASGAATDVGAWGNGATRIGCDFNAVKPQAPALNVA